MSQDNNEAAAEPALVLLSKAEVLRRVPVSWPTIWNWIRQGRFPKPRALGPNKTVWLESDINEWVKAQPIRSYKA
jgi:predicted DNA-binding transcriptional regulator AlpA